LKVWKHWKYKKWD